MKGLVTFLFVLASVSITLGQYTVESSVSKSRVAVSEVFTFVISMNNFDCDALQPEFGGLEVVGGPNPNQSTISNITNGVHKTINEFSWTYNLRAPELGKYTISGVTMSCGDKSYTTDPIVIEVVDASELKEDPEYFLRLTSNKSTVYEGEPFIVMLKYYSKNRPESLEGVKLGDLVGISRYNLNPNRTSFQTQIERIDGMKYYTIELHEDLCYAQRSGTVRLEPYYASVIFGDLFNKYRRESLSNSLEIEVQPLPGSDDGLFRGLVGRYAIKSDINKKKVEIGEAIDYKITLEGVGNLDQTLIQFKPNFPDVFNSFEPQVVETTTATRSGLSGKIEYSFTLVPTKAGTFELPADTLYYFDLKRGGMQIIISQPYKIEVKKGEGYVPSTDTHTAETEVKKDIHYIDETSDDFFERDDFLFGTWTYYGALASPLILFFILVGIRRKRDNITEEGQLKIQQKKAIKTAEAELKVLRESMGNDKETLKALQRIFIHFFKTKFNVGLSDLTQREIENRLRKNELPDSVVEKYLAIWKAIEMGQFAPIQHENLLDLVSESDALIHQIDKLI